MSSPSEELNYEEQKQELKIRTNQEPFSDEEIGAAESGTTREAEIKSKIHFIKTALKNLKSNFPQFKSVRSLILNILE